MILIDTSGWIEYFNNPDHRIIKYIDYALDNELICLGDLIYCEVLQGVKHKKELMRVKDVFDTFQLILINNKGRCAQRIECVSGTPA